MSLKNSHLSEAVRKVEIPTMGKSESQKLLTNLLHTIFEII